ncbi:MAG TPA: TIGR00180 family glycosyltransferase [Chitinophagaceae bacterium]|nr:TIGR00180 family glycosyltransferase [Chitinophagaceae bacterium]
MQGITLIIPSHNRHLYLDRILAYYRSTAIKILVADSTELPYTPKETLENVTYLHIPGFTLTKKIPYVLSLVETPFVVMCADDDFTTPEAIRQCVGFLLENEDYTSALGNCICYRKNSVNSGHVKFAAMYTDRLSYQFVAADPFQRLKNFFQVYRTIFYAVHRTKVINDAFKGADKVITNLFLNEYNSAILPVLKGKIAGLPFLMQVREFAENSDDKTTINLDAVFTDHEYSAAYQAFLDFEAPRMAEATGTDAETCRAKLDTILMDHAKYLLAQKNNEERDIIKRIGSNIESIPVVGKKAIAIYRFLDRRRKLRRLVSTESDRLNLAKIRKFINQYKDAVRT